LENPWQHFLDSLREPRSGGPPVSPEIESENPTLVALPQSDSHLSSDLVALVGTQTGAALATVAIEGAPALSTFTVDSIGRIAVHVTATDVPALLPHLESLGFQTVSSLPDRHLVEGFLPISALADVESLGSAGLLGVTPVYKPVTSAGSVENQADVVHETVRVRGTLPTGYDGTGITIGVLSDSYDTSLTASTDASDDIASGDLPADVVVLEEGPTGSDEGRAMLQLIHDLAPGADLVFATAFLGEASFAQNILDLANPAIGNADVIVDDVVYLNEPYFQDGIIAQAVDTAVQTHGVAYFSSAGNRSTQAWESTTISVTTDSGFAGSFVDFDPTAGADSRQLISLANGQRFRPALQWDDPFYTVSGVDTNLNLFLVEAGTTTVVASTTTNNITTQSPAEILDFTNGTGSSQQYELLIQVVAGPDPGRVKYVNFGSSGVISEYQTNSPTVNPHAAATHGAGVAAVFYGSQTVAESFTSQGPTTILFATDGTRLETPEVRQSVRFAAVDGTDTTFFGSDSDGNGFPNFFGTSAAAPHAAAIAALILQANPGMTGDQVYERMADTATDIGVVGYDNVTGAGLVNAYDAIFGPATPANLNVSDGFEAAVLSGNWETHSTGPGRILVTGDNTPNAGTQHLTMDTFASLSTGSGLNEAILHVDATGMTNIQLSFSQKESGDEDHAMTASFTGSQESDGVAFSVDGETWYRLVSLTGANSTSSWQDFSFDLSAAAVSAGVTLGSDVRIKFQQYDNFPFPSDGMAFDDIVVTGTDTSPPTIESVSPADNATDVPLTSPLVITFSEAVVAGTGNIVVQRVQDAQVVQILDVTSGAVSIDGDTVTVDLADLGGSTEYAVLIDSTAFEDLTGQAFEGISSTTAWTFTTANAAPVAQANVVTTDEDTPHVFSVSDFPFADQESDSMSSITVSSLNLAAGDALTVDLGVGAVTVTNGMMITAAQIATFTYTPAAEASGAARSTFQFTVNDATAGAVAAVLSITVDPVNDFPVATASSISTDEDTSWTFAATDFVYSDLEDDELVSITIDNLELAVGDTLTVDLGDGAVAVTDGMVITAAQISSLTYTPLAHQFGSPRSTFDFAVNDTEAGVILATMDLNVTALNDVPAAAASSVTTDEDTPYTFTEGDFQFSDVEGDPLASITIHGLSLAAGDRLTVDLGAGTVDVGIGMTITAGQIPTLVYSPAENASGASRSTIEFAVNDGGVGVTTALMSLSVEAIADAPEIAAFGETIAYTAGGTAVLIDFNATVQDVDSTTFAGGQLTFHVSANLEATDRLEIRPVTRMISVSGNNVTYRGTLIGTISGGIGSDLVITLNGNATISAVQTLLRSVTYRSVSESPSLEPRSIEVTLTDGSGGTSLPVTKTVTVSAALVPGPELAAPIPPEQSSPAAGPFPFESRSVSGHGGTARLLLRWEERLDNIFASMDVFC